MDNWHDVNSKIALPQQSHDLGIKAVLIADVVILTSLVTFRTAFFAISANHEAEVL